MNEQDQQAKHRGRRYRGYAYGDTPDELEPYALNKAREIFGKDARLEVVRDYTVYEVDKFSVSARRQAENKKLRADIFVLVHD